jgi:hypothetical protein
MTGTLKKIAKGTLAIFAIKLFFFGAMLINQSCSNDSLYEEGVSTNQLELQRFISSVKKANKKIKNNILLTNLKNKSLNHSEKGGSKEEKTELEAKKILGPVMADGIDLLKSYGVTEAEIIAEFGSLNSPDIAMASLAVYRVEQLAQNGQMIKEFDENLDYNFATLFLGVQNTYAQSGIGNCTLEALGVNAVISGFSGGIKKLGKKGVLKIIRKVATKYLGFVGAVIAVLDFADCMGWFGDAESHNETDTGTATSN